MKCDEGKPACRRCVSTGRTCDGYGIWGGGGNRCDNWPERRELLTEYAEFLKSHVAPAISLVCMTEKSAFTFMSTSERQCFDWFRIRTSTKLPGAFMTPFWQTLIFQACHTERSVLHAVLALTSFHRRVWLGEATTTGEQQVLNREEQFTLQQYGKAIRHLRSHLKDGDTASIRVTLITCVVFTYLELLRGRFKAADSHLQSGLMLLSEMETSKSAKPNDALVLETSREVVDDWIKLAFTRINFQVELFREPGTHKGLIFPRAIKERLPIIFHSTNQARQYLDVLLNKIFYLSKHGRRRAAQGLEGPGEELLGHQQQVKADLLSWSNAYKAAKAQPQSHYSALDSLSFLLMRLHHTMACIMVDAALQPADEQLYDKHIVTFQSIISQAIHIWKTFCTITTIEETPDFITDKSKAIAEMGWIPPLYYTALKCRDHQLRLQSINLLSLSHHREGIWDTKTVVCVAQKVVELEERGFYGKSSNVSALFPRQNHPLQLLPQSYRFHDVYIDMPEEMAGNFRITCKQKQSDGSWGIFTSEYNVMTGCWSELEWVNGS